MDEDAKPQVARATVGAMKFAIIAAAFAVFTSACSVDTPAASRSAAWCCRPAPSRQRRSAATPWVPGPPLSTQGRPYARRTRPHRKPLRSKAGVTPFLGKSRSPTGRRCCVVPGAATPASRDVVTKAITLANAYRRGGRGRGQFRRRGNRSGMATRPRRGERGGYGDAGGMQMMDLGPCPAGEWRTIIPRLSMRTRPSTPSGSGRGWTSPSC